MTLQAKGFQWSISIHGVLLLIVLVLQYFAVSQNKITVIDFTLSGNSMPSTVEQSLPNRVPAAKQEPKNPRLIRPKEIFKAHITPNPEVETVHSFSEAAINREDSPAIMPQDAANSSTASAKDAFQDEPINTGSVESSSLARPGVTPEISRATYLKEHFAYIRDRINGGISYPHMARKMGWCGQVKIAFVICENGAINNVTVLESSGFKLLDRNAVDTVKKVAPFPPPPVKAEIRMSISYELN